METALASLGHDSAALFAYRCRGLVRVHEGEPGFTEALRASDLVSSLEGIASGTLKGVADARVALGFSFRLAAGPRAHDSAEAASLDVDAIRRGSAASQAMHEALWRELALLAGADETVAAVVGALALCWCGDTAGSWEDLLATAARAVSAERTGDGSEPHA